MFKISEAYDVIPDWYWMLARDIGKENPPAILHPIAKICSNFSNNDIVRVWSVDSDFEYMRIEVRQYDTGDISTHEYDFESGLLHLI